jgi:tRNA-dihydrouridine synthase B
MLNQAPKQLPIEAVPAAGILPASDWTGPQDRPGPLKPVRDGIPSSHDLLDGIEVVLAPLAGITDWIFRGICFQFGVDMAVSEMISSDAVTRTVVPLRAMRHLDERRGPLALQIFGADPGRMAETAARLSEYRPLLIDLNFGCPVKKIVKGKGGAALLLDIPLLARICREVVRRSRVPVSAKIRTGWDTSDPLQLAEIARVIEGEGLSVITVHARTRSQAYSGAADWDMIKTVKQVVSIPVIGNGDVKSADDFINMKNQTGCDAVMIGRAAIGNPWIFAEIKARLEGARFESPAPNNRIEVLLEQLRLSVQELGEPLGIISVRRVIAAYLKFLPGARGLRGALMSLERLEEIEKVLTLYLNTHEG